jgi:hypothetical protein
MSLDTIFIIATFTVPETIGTNPQSFLWLLPLTASIAIVYKATKVPIISAKDFIKKSAALAGSIVAFIIIAALVLYAVARLFT